MGKLAVFGAWGLLPFSRRVILVKRESLNVISNARQESDLEATSLLRQEDPRLGHRIRTEILAGTTTRFLVAIYEWRYRVDVGAGTVLFFPLSALPLCLPASRFSPPPSPS